MMTVLNPAVRAMTQFDEHDNLPKHVAIIMDGNGRWAEHRGLRRTVGHRHGVEAVRRVTRAARDFGIQYLTLFSFSTENWTRPKSEVNELFTLLKLYIRKDLAELHQNNVKVVIVGEREGLPGDILPLLVEAERLTGENTGQTLVIAFNYGARHEIAAAAAKIAAKAVRGEIEPSKITPEIFERHLMTAGIPDPDLVIRTSGEKRLSNFLAWQTAYSEFVFTDTLWPDFTASEFAAAIVEYCARQRRFGGTDGQHRSRDTGS